MTQTKIQIAQDELAALNNQVSVAQNKVANANALCRRISWVDQECVKRLTLELQTEQQRATSKEEEIKNLKADREADLDKEINSFGADGIDNVLFIQDKLQEKGFSLDEINARLEALGISDGTSLLVETPITQTCGPEITLPEDEKKPSGDDRIEQPIDYHHHN